MRRMLRNLSALAVVLVILPVASEFFIELARSYGLFNDPQAKLRGFLDSITVIASHWLYPWIAGGTVGLCVGVWLDSALRRSEKSTSWIVTTPPETQVEDAIKEILAHAGWPGSEERIWNASSTINSNISEFVDEQYTRHLLRAIQAASQALAYSDEIYKDPIKNSEIKNIVQECCKYLLKHFNKKSNHRNKMCQEFIQRRKALLGNPKQPDAGA